MNKTLRIADHLRQPGGRYIGDGDYSGEWFRDSILKPAFQQAIQEDYVLTIELDGIQTGYSAAFLDEVFGGLVRNNEFSQTDRDHLAIVTTNGLYHPYRGLAERYFRSSPVSPH